MCALILCDEGFKVEIAIDGKAALDRLEQKEYALCLIEIRMPEVNGIEFYRHLEERYPRLINKVIFTSGDVLSATNKQFLEKGNKPFLPKPFTLDELRAIVKVTRASI